MKLKEIPAGYVVGLVVVAFGFAVSAFYYPQLPEEMAIHWDVSGQPDDTVSKDIGGFLLPVVSVILLVVFVAIPRIDPLRENIEEFRRYYEGFVVLMLLSMLYFHMVILLWNTGNEFNILQAVAPVIGAIFYYTGILLENAERNWFVGIRTPWTLSDDEVWKKTHYRGSILFRLSGIIAVLGFLLEEFAAILVVVPVVLTAVYTVVYSYLEYRKKEEVSGV